MSKDAGTQAVDFFLKRADYAAGLAVRHCKDNEFDKGANLYKEAYGYMKKAEAAVPDDMQIKQKLEELKQKYQEAKKNADAKKAC
jgi:hypothetical protein